MKQVIQDTTLSMRILKIASCPTCSGKGKLTYHLGCNAKSEIYLRVISNNGGGFFSPEWVSLNAIQQALDKAVQPITSLVLYPLFHGKSVNTPAFLLAALISEGLLQPIVDKQRNYERTDSTGFITEVKKLIASKVDLNVTEAVLPIKKAAATSKKVATLKA